jgi:hypothetical protein
MVSTTWHRVCEKSVAPLPFRGDDRNKPCGENMTGRAIGCFAAVFALIAMAWSLRADGDTPNPTSPMPESSAKVSLPVGMSSCAASACHGNANANSLTAAPDRNCWQSSLTHFLAVDPHRRAFDVLKNEQSHRITAALRKGSNVAIPDAPNDSRCLACHTNPSLAHDSVTDAAKALRSEGIGCEACHGNAHIWRATHTTWTPATRDRGITSTTFHDLNSMTIRAESCAGCHIGAPAGDGYPARDMNHDMIAAGHPALPGDLTALMNRYPKHWFERDRQLADAPERKLDEAWNAIAGQAKSAASRTLSKDRQARNDGRTPWPELAETKCTDCHRTLPP